MVVYVWVLLFFFFLYVFIEIDGEYYIEGVVFDMFNFMFFIIDLVIGVVLVGEVDILVVLDILGEDCLICKLCNLYDVWVCFIIMLLVKIF